MKRGFIRGVWGVYDNSTRIRKRRARINKDINRIKRCKFNEPFRIYVLGKSNYQEISEKFDDCVLVDKAASLFDIDKYQYRNKLALIQYAMEVDGYDEIVYLDWDVVPQKKLPEDFWEQMNQKDVFQANLQVYHRRKCHWRPKDLRKVPNGGFLYIRDKAIPAKAIEFWETIKGDNDEPAWAKLTDEMVGGWKGSDVYWDRFEPMFCNLWRASAFPEEEIAKKDVCFIHYQGG